MKEIEYYRPKFTRKLGAAMMDAFLFSMLSLCLVVATKEIGATTKQYKENEQKIDQIRLDSGLFVLDEENKARDIITYYNLDKESSSSTVEKAVCESIDNFFTYVDQNLSHELYLSMVEEYNNLKIDEGNTYSFEGKTYKLYVEKNGEIIKNDEVVVPYKAYTAFYKKYIDNYALGYFYSKIEDVVSIQKYFSYVMAVEIIVSLLVSSIIIYYVFPLIFRRGRKTLGRLVFSIGLVNKDVLNVSFKQFSLRFLIIFFLEVLLSVFTLGIPLIFSFTMSVFTKKKEYFHDYLLQIEEVDLQDNTVYFSKDEISKPSSKDDIHNFSLK